MVKRARQLRKEMTPPERRLWRQLRLRPGGYKFRPQHPEAHAILDFACLETRLCIEVDGEIHGRGDQPEKDERRDAYLRGLGYSILRIPAREIFRDLDATVTAIVTRCGELGPLHHRPSAGGPPPRSGEDAEEQL